MNANPVAAVVLLALVGAGPAAAQSAAKADAPPKAVDNYDELYYRYLVAARETGVTPAPAPPRMDWMTDLTGDFRARHVNDLLTVHVVESIAASGTAGTTLDKSSSGTTGISGLFGLEGKLPSFIDPTNLLGSDTSSDFKGGGATNRTGQLSATMTVRVAEVLPNGDLVLEGAREIDINGDRQIVVLTGVVRPSDVPPTNVVSSMVVGQLRIRYFGRGLIKDNLKPGWLIRILNKIF
ncbi:MAG: flagellar basal body L-ring protein FlgH [Vicinamibacterales bacterium]